MAGKRLKNLITMATRVDRHGTKAWVYLVRGIFIWGIVWIITIELLSFSKTFGILLSAVALYGSVMQILLFLYKDTNSGIGRWFDAKFKKDEEKKLRRKISNDNEQKLKNGSTMEVKTTYTKKVSTTPEKLHNGFPILLDIKKISYYAVQTRRQYTRVRVGRASMGSSKQVGGWAFVDKGDLILTTESLYFYGSMNKVNMSILKIDRTTIERWPAKGIKIFLHGQNNPILFGFGLDAGKKINNLIHEQLKVKI